MKEGNNENAIDLKGVFHRKPDLNWAAFRASLVIGADGFSDEKNLNQFRQASGWTQSLLLTSRPDSEL